MSNQRDEDFDSIYASIEDDDMEEMYVDVSSTPPNEIYDGPDAPGPSPYMYPQAPWPPSPNVRKLPPLPGKSTAGAATKPPWPRKAPHPPPNQPSVKVPKKPGSSEPNRDVPQPLPRVGTLKKKEFAAGKPAVKSKPAALYQQQGTASKMGYSPPPPVIAANPDERQAHATGYQQHPQEVAATNAATLNKTRYHQDSGFGTGKYEPRYKLDYAGKEPPVSTGPKLPYHQPPPPSNPPPPLQRGTNGQGFTGQLLNTPAEDESEYESLRPARQRILRGFGQQNRRSRRYSDDRIPLQDLASDHEDNMSDGGYRARRENGGGGGGGGEGVQNNSKIVCILLTIIVIALLISLMSLVMSLYTLTRFELSLRVNNTASECDVKVTNCTTAADSLDIDCQPVTDPSTHDQVCNICTAKITLNLIPPVS